MRIPGLRPVRTGRWPAVVACALVCIVAPGIALAEDEDTSSQVYLVFDPETGEFITSHDPDAALPAQTGLEASQGSAGSTAQPGDAEHGEGGPPVLLTGAALLVILGVAGVAFARLRRRSA